MSVDGEACFLSREPRRVGLQAAIDSTAGYLPLDSMDPMAGRDPMATRRFTQVMMIILDIILRAFTVTNLKGLKRYADSSVE